MMMLKTFDTYVGNKKNVVGLKSVFQVKISCMYGNARVYFYLDIWPDFFQYMKVMTTRITLPL